MQTHLATRIRRLFLSGRGPWLPSISGTLRVHPFADGNHHMSFVALSAALWSFGLPNIEFDDDADTIAHDDALVPVLESTNGSVEPSRSCWLISSSAR